MQQTNWYTIVFALAMTLLVSAGLASLKGALAPMQDANELLFNKKSILSSVMTVDKTVDAESIFNEKVKGYLVDHEGNIIREDTDGALKVAAPTELKKVQRVDLEIREMPLFIFTESDQSKRYILPTFGGGLWGWISSFVALGEDGNTIVGISFDHETETPGLGAQIKDDEGFYGDFIGEKIFNEQGEFVSVNVLKGNGDPANNDKTDHEIDGISGATITADGVTDMLKEDLATYTPFLMNETSSK